MGDDPHNNKASAVTVVSDSDDDDDVEDDDESGTFVVLEADGDDGIRGAAEVEEQRPLFQPQPPVNREDLAKDVRFDLGEGGNGGELNKKRKKRKNSECSNCLIFCAAATGCILFIMAMTLVLTFATVAYKGILAKSEALCDAAAGSRNQTAEGIFPREADDSSEDINSGGNSSDTVTVKSDGAGDTTDVNQKVLSILKQSKYHDCSKILEEDKGKASRSLSSGVFRIRFSYGPSLVRVRVRCDMTSMGGGWTVFQSRGQFENPEDFFSTGWDRYHRGFGDEEGEFWLGLAVLQMLTEVEEQELLVQLWDDKGSMAYARYSHFNLSNDGLYRLSASGYSGNAGDALGYSHGLAFTTRDRDRDRNLLGNCAEENEGGWWFDDCAKANLNGLNPQQASNGTQNNGIVWSKGNCGKIWTRAEMKIRPLAFRSKVEKEEEEKWEENEASMSVC